MRITCTVYKTTMFPHLRPITPAAFESIIIADSTLRAVLIDDMFGTVGLHIRDNWRLKDELERLTGKLVDLYVDRWMLSPKVHADAAAAALLAQARDAFALVQSDLPCVVVFALRPDLGFNDLCVVHLPPDTWRHELPKLLDEVHTIAAAVLGQERAAALRLGHGTPPSVEESLAMLTLLRRRRKAPLWTEERVASAKRALLTLLKLLIQATIAS
jgi:hypothetical protein